MARVRIKRQYTLIDHSGQEIIPRYRDVHIYGEQGFIGAEKADGGEDFFDLYGKPLTASALQAVYMARDREKAEQAARLHSSSQYSAACKMSCAHLPCVVFSCIAPSARKMALSSARICAARSRSARLTR